MYQQLIDSLSKETKILLNEPMKNHTSFKIGGPADILIMPGTIDDIKKVIDFAKDIPLYIIGNGSNLLVNDEGIKGIVLKISNCLNTVTVEEDCIIAESGATLALVSNIAKKNSLTGMEWACGIPGSIGGAVYMNAGAYKSDMGYIVQQVKVLTPDLKVITLSNKEMNFHYRSSFLQSHPGYICLEVVLKLTKGDKDALDEVIKERRKRRMESQPLEFPSAGSVFRNPEGMFAGQLIEEAGLKGKMIGGAMVSEKHANFIINYKNAKSSEIKELIELVHDTVLEKYNVDMRCEQEFVNWE